MHYRGCRIGYPARTKVLPSRDKANWSLSLIFFPSSRWMSWLRLINRLFFQGKRISEKDNNVNTLRIEYWHCSSGVCKVPVWILLNFSFAVFRKNVVNRNSVICCQLVSGALYHSFSAFSIINIEIDRRLTLPHWIGIQNTWKYSFAFSRVHCGVHHPA